MTLQPLQTFIFNPQAQYLFKRAYAVSLGPPNQQSALQYGTIGVSPAPLRIKFEIEKTMFGASPNHSKIDIYNLSIQSRSSIKKGYLVQLQAGYNNLLGTIFTGNVFVAKTERDGSEIMTSLECLDGGSAIIMAVLDKSYGEGVKLSQILQDVATAMSVVTNIQPVGVNSGIILGIPNVIFNTGFVAHGPCKDTLDKLLTPMGLEWNVQNGNLNIIPKRNFDGNTAQIVSVDTGMIGVPSQNEGFVQFTSLLNPKLVPGALVQLVSENKNLNGYFKIRKSKFEGDSHDNKWQVSCEACIMSNVTQTLPASKGFDINTAVV